MNALVDGFTLTSVDSAVNLEFDGQFGQIESRFEAQSGILWSYMNPRGRACFTTELLDDIRAHESRIERGYGRAIHNGVLKSIDYVVFGSKVPGVFNFGGDLNLFKELIESKNRDRLQSYAKQCIVSLHARIAHFNLPLTTIALVQGEALGGGMECALASQVIIAEKSAEMGLPEVLFNLFPGMGGYSFLVRKIGPDRADQFIKSGRRYNAEELHALGVVDVVAEDGRGENAVYDYIRRNERKRNAYLGMQMARELVNPITIEELYRIGDVWVDTALGLTDRDLRMMHRLVNAQKNKAQSQFGSDQESIDLLSAATA